MPVRRALKGAAFLMLLLFAACKGKSIPTGPTTSLSGVWSGSSSGLTFSVTLLEAGDGTISGSAEIGGNGVFLNATVTGSHSRSSVGLTFTIPNISPAFYAATYANDNTLNGNLNGSGFSNSPMTLTRSGREP